MLSEVSLFGKNSYHAFRSIKYPTYKLSNNNTTYIVMTSLPKTMPK